MPKRRDGETYWTAGQFEALRMLLPRSFKVVARSRGDCWLIFSIRIPKSNRCVNWFRSDCWNELILRKPNANSTRCSLRYGPPITFNSIRNHNRLQHYLPLPVFRRGAGGEGGIAPPPVLKWLDARTVNRKRHLLPTPTILPNSLTTTNPNRTTRRNQQSSMIPCRVVMKSPIIVLSPPSPPSDPNSCFNSVASIRCTESMSPIILPSPMRPNASKLWKAHSNFQPTSRDSFEFLPPMSFRPDLWQPIACMDGCWNWA